MHKLILLRHGQSDWNRENRFTGWTDVDLSRTGIDEYELDYQLRPMHHEYLGDPEQVRRAIEAVASQGKGTGVGGVQQDESSTTRRTM